jgi:cytochrome c peroxidase
MNPVEMGMTDEKAVVAELSKVKWYGEQFKKAFPEEKTPASFDNLAKAIGAFERKLVTPSRWDKYLAGDKAALTTDEKAGFKAFTTAGCPTCHSGAYVGGAMFQKLGLAKPWTDEKDLGRYEVTKDPAEKMFFKVPGLRNVEKTAPYFHDGSVATLPEAIKLMGRHQLGKELSDAEVASIATWLKALTGDVPTELIAESKIPPEARSPVAKGASVPK